MRGAAMPADVIAHRGASAYADEHTFAAYDLALAQGADVLEIDVRATGDGEVVVVHDATLRRTTGDPRRVDALTRPALAGLGDRRPPSLAAVLARYGATTRYLVELKDPHPAWETRVVDTIARRGVEERVVLQSFDPHALRRLHARAPDIAVAPLLMRLPRRMEALREFASGVGVWHTALTAPLVRRAHDSGLAVRAWTANAPDEIDRLLACGVDAVITDRPDVARGLVDRAAPALAA
jgi:glycerophosphoryl diester phosphodiesterase